MKTLKSFTLIALVMALFGLVQSARAQYTYTDNGDGTCTITGYTGAGGAVVIPSTINGLTVVRIGPYAFINNTSLTDVTIPASVTSVGTNAFALCYGLTGAGILGNTSIEYQGFYFCTNMTIFAGIGNITSLGDYAFGGCKSMINETRPVKGDIGQLAFDSCYSLTNVALLDGITNIGQYAFSYCSNLLFLTIPNTVTNLGPFAFEHCTKLAGVILSTNLTSIQTATFFGCTNLSSIIIPSRVASVGSSAFAFCSRLDFILFRGNVPTEDDPGQTFFDNSQLPFIYYLAGTTGWGTTFDGISTRSFDFTYTIGNGEVTIKSYIGSGGPAIIPSNIEDMPVTSTYPNAFYNANFSSITIPDSVTFLGDDTFYNCTSLASVSIGNGITRIPTSAFLNCTQLVNVTLGNNVTSIGEDAFGNCGLTSFTIPNSVTNVGDQAFISDYSLVHLTIGTGITSIGNDVFVSCRSLTNVTIPDNITSIGTNAFEGCQSMTSVTIGTGVTNIAPYAFSFCYDLKSLLIPDNVTLIGADAFDYCVSMTGAIIGTGVTSIGDSAFADCHFLTQIYFLGNAPAIGSQVFTNDVSSPIAYYQPGATGWSSTFGGIPAQESLFNYSIADGAVTLTGYNGAGGTVNIPATLGGLPVVSITNNLFANNSSVTFVNISASVTNIGTGAFSNCVNLLEINVDSGNAFYSSVNGVLFDKNQGTLIQFPGGQGGIYVIPDSVSTIASDAFADCTNLISVIIPAGVSSVGDNAFADCGVLDAAYFQGNAPTDLGNAFSGDSSMTVFYFSGTGGWGSTFGGAPTELSLFNFTVNSGLVTITAYNGTSGIVTIPSTIDNMTVVSIGDYAFNSDNVTNVTITGNVSIGTGSFANCASLTNITISDSVSSIGDYAFYNSGLVNATLPSSLSSIGNYMFQYCGNLAGVTIPDGVNSIGSGAFANCASLTNIVIPDSVNSIGDSAFFDSGLVDVTLSTNLAGIGNSVFQYCTGLTNIMIPDSVASIGGNAFANCTGLTNFTISDNVTNVGAQAFFNCAGLTNITVGSGVISIGDQAFADCGNLLTITVNPTNSAYSSTNGVLFDFDQTTLVEFPGGVANYTVPDSVTNIAGDAFAYCANLTNIAISAGVSTIGDNAFANCTGLPAFTIPDTVTSLGNGVFQFCSGLRNISIGTGITSIGANEFYNCGLTNVVIPNNVTTIGYQAFINCYSLAHVTIPNSVTNIGSYAFSYCGLTSVVLPDSLTSIGYSVFFNDNSLTSVIIPDSVTSIGYYAFYGCGGLVSVTIPASITSVNSEAFGNCYNLTSVLFLGNAVPDTFDQFDSDPATVYYVSGATGWGSSFGGVQTQLYPFNFTIADGAVTITGYNGSGGSLTIPPIIANLPVVGIAPSAFAGVGLTDVTIPNSVTNVGDQAFASCTSLNFALFQGDAPTDVGTAFSGDSGATVYYLPGTAGWGSTFGGAPTQVWIQPGFNYAVTNGVVTITGYTDTNDLVIIPNTIAGLPVTSIGASAFYGSGVMGVTIPTSITNVGDQAFASCTSLVSAFFLRLGNAPADVGTAFSGDSNATVYYQPGATGWGSTFGGIAATQMQFYYFVNNGAITIQGYQGSGTTLAIPSFIGGWLVNGIQSYAYIPAAGSFTNVTVPASLTNIATAPFNNLPNLKAITVDPANPFYSSVNGVLFDKNLDVLIEFPKGVTGSYTIPDGVTTIQTDAFGFGQNLASVTIPASVTNIQDYAFEYSSLTSVVFAGNAPTDLGDAFFGDANVVYYVPGTTGWGSTFGGVPTAVWNPQGTSFSASGNQFAFNIIGPTNSIVIVEAATNLANPVWLPVATNTLVNGVGNFSDTQFANYANRFYRFRLP